MTAFPVTVALRLAIGVLFLVAAPACRLPDLVRLVGVLELAGAAILIVSGAERLRRFVAWWLRRPRSFVRGWCLVAFLVGGVLAYAGA